MTDDPRIETHEEIAELIRSVEVPAPEHLHERIREMTQAGAGSGERRSPRAGALRLRLGAAMTAAAAGVTALVLALAGGSGGAALSLADASAVTLRGATMGAPAESPRDRSDLNAAVDGVRFPYWGERFGWRSTGSRVDEVAGRSFRTVFYSDGRGHTVGYAIVAGSSALEVSGAGREEWRAGTLYRLGRVRGAEVVTWKRDGHLCIVSGRGVAGSTLLALASWHERAPAA